MKMRHAMEGTHRQIDFSGAININNAGEIKSIILNDRDVADYSIDTFFSLLGFPGFEELIPDDPGVPSYEDEGIMEEDGRER